MENNPLNQVERHIQSVMLYAPGMLANDAVNFFLDRFREQGWLGTGFQPWRQRKAVTKWGGTTKRNSGRAILIDSGRLRRSIRATSIMNGEIKIGSDVPYAKAHNEGMRLGLIQQVGQFERKRFGQAIVKKKTLKKRSNITWGKVQTGTIKVKAHTRRVNMRIPQRQFMGDSQVLRAKLIRRLETELMKGGRYK